jgi:hypothetical protein
MALWLYARGGVPLKVVAAGHVQLDIYFLAIHLPIRAWRTKQNSNNHLLGFLFWGAARFTLFS